LGVSITLARRARAVSPSALQRPPIVKNCEAKRKFEDEQIAVDKLASEIGASAVAIGSSGL
jgi:hypothetical protein